MPVSLTALLFAFAFTWPGQKPNTEESKPKTEEKSGPSKTQASSGSGPRVVSVIPRSRLPEIPKAPKVVKPPVVTAVMPARPPAADTRIAEIRAQIEGIVKLNESLKARYRDQAAEIQRITEQARIHQRILSDLETARKVRTAVRPVDTTEILEQEKIKLIKQETQKNQNFLQDLEKGRTSESKEGKPAA